MRSGTMDLPLHPGSCPPWLFKRMRSFAAAISRLIVEEYGSKELLRRLSDPLFFQALNCASAMDWHSSGSTTTLTAALKLGFADIESGIVGCGGKGKTSKKTPGEIETHSERFNLSDSKRERLLEATRMSAKVDSSCIQDCYSLYHHSFFFDEKGNWAVIQQGLSQMHGYARRYHWLETDNFVDGPPENIAGQRREDRILNLVSPKTPEARGISVDLVKDNPRRLQKYFSGQTTLSDAEHFQMPRRHEILGCDLSRKDWEMLERAYELQPKDYKELVSLQGMGKKKLRALALIARLVHGSRLDFEDPAKYAFAHGGKDHTPYPADRGTYDHTIRFLESAVEGAELESKDRKAALKRLSGL